MPIPSKVPESEALNTMFEALAVAASFPLPSFCACPGQPKSVGLGTAAEAQESALISNVLGFQEQWLHNL